VCNKVEDVGMFFKRIQDDAKAIKAVKELHSKRHPSGLLCAHCKRRYPCPTIQILGEENDSNANRTINS
jgi:hypothetical protein